MSVKRCDVLRHITRRGKVTQGEVQVEGILEEEFRQCTGSRVAIVSGDHGRVGVCLECLNEFHEFRLSNQGKPTKDKDPWVRMRRGKQIMGSEVPKKEEG